jgi:hypothetical protein
MFEELSDVPQTWSEKHQQNQNGGPNGIRPDDEFYWSGVLDKGAQDLRAVESPRNEQHR